MSKEIMSAEELNKIFDEMDVKARTLSHMICSRMDPADHREMAKQFLRVAIMYTLLEQLVPKAYKSIASSLRAAVTDVVPSIQFKPEEVQA